LKINLEIREEKGARAAKQRTEAVMAARTDRPENQTPKRCPPDDAEIIEPDCSVSKTKTERKNGLV